MCCFGWPSQCYSKVLTFIKHPARSGGLLLKYPKRNNSITHQYLTFGNLALDVFNLELT